MEPRDANGMTEEEFLASYNPGNWEHPSVTADIVIFRRLPEREGEYFSDSLNSISGSLELLLIKRGGHPYLGRWALPGGFAEKGEYVEETAARELLEETRIEGVPLEQLGVYSKPGRDPRGWTVTSAYVALVEDALQAEAGDDAADARWFSIRVKRRGELLELTARNGDDIARIVFSLVNQPFSAPRAKVVESEGLAFDHEDIIADAYLRICSRD